jgi:hypothetical protein
MAKLGRNLPWGDAGPPHPSGGGVAEGIGRAALDIGPVAGSPQAPDASDRFALKGDRPAIKGLPQSVRQAHGGTVFLSHLLALGWVEVDEAEIEVDLACVQFENGLGPGGGSKRPEHEGPNVRGGMGVDAAQLRHVELCSGA